MLIEIPNPLVIFNVIAAFLVGLGGLYVYYKIRPLVKFQNTANSTYAERLEYYERQLIDMRIKLDALEVQGVEQKIDGAGPELKQLLEKLAGSMGQERPGQEAAHTQPKTTEDKQPLLTGFESNNTNEHVLRLITSKDMTSRDIQVTLNHSREHTSRLLKKLFEGGYVQRTQTKPYVYSITQRGREKIAGVESGSPAT